MRVLFLYPCCCGVPGEGESRGVRLVSETNSMAGPSVVRSQNAPLFFVLPSLFQYCVDRRGWPCNYSQMKRTCKRYQCEDDKHSEETSTRHHQLQGVSISAGNSNESRPGATRKGTIKPIIGCSWPSRQRGPSHLTSHTARAADPVDAILQ